MKNINKSGLALAVMALMATSSMSFAAESHDTAKKGCIGVNACKGQSSCKTVKNSCKGQNACKSQGKSELTTADCAKAGGKVEK